MNRLEKKEAVRIDQLIGLALKSYGLSAQHNTRRIAEAWNAASGAGAYTSRRYFRDGKLYVTLNSSVVRSQLMFQKDLILEKMNAIIAGDPLFIKDDNATGCCIKELILK